MIQPIDVEQLRKRTQSAVPFPHFVLDNFLDPAFAHAVHDSFPPFEEARKIGVEFRSVNEKHKVQITDSARFAPRIRELHSLLSAHSWLETLSFVFGIPNLLADDELIGGGIHQTGPRGRLDVHIDFNYISERQLHRRLNILIFFNPDWNPAWGGRLEFWDRGVQQCLQSFDPLFNRCVIFETSGISFHGVTAVHCPPGRARKSFAAYYYTQEPPAHWTGKSHNTIFRSRPDEVVLGRVLMPAQRAWRSLRQSVWDLRRGIKRIVKPRD